jgi:hypothetical protein
MVIIGAGECGMKSQGARSSILTADIALLLADTGRSSITRKVGNEKRAMLIQS